VVPLVAPVESNGPHRHLRVTPSNSFDHTTLRERMQLRRELRARRAGLSAAQRLSAARKIAAHVGATRWLQGRRPIGLYSSVGYEVETGPLLALARQRHCPVYLPRIADYRQRRMVFALASLAPGIRNRHGIAEPAARALICARGLSVVFLPLLGFDPRGTRLGSGAGYYDRLFSFRRHRQQWRRPLLIGLAYGCQRLPYIQAGEHDVPLDAVVSEHGVTHFSSQGATT
jgi:5-formyltetrahydrofolate cyclo-ligase